MDSNKTYDDKDRSRSRSKSGSSHSRKSHRNPYLNFVRDVRECSQCPLTYKEALIKAGKAWRKMSNKDKKPYVDEASNVSRDAPPKKSTKKNPKGTSDKKKNTKSSKKKGARRTIEDCDGASTSTYCSSCDSE